MGKFSHDYYLPKKPNTKFKEAVSDFHNWYKEKNLLPYLYGPKDFANLKILIRKLDQVDITLIEFLDNIESPWHLANISIPLLNSHFNQLVKSTGSEFPITYNPTFEKTLTPDQLPKYWQHLTKLGYKKVYNMGGSTWAK